MSGGADSDDGNSSDCASDFPPTTASRRTAACLATTSNSGQRGTAADVVNAGRGATRRPLRRSMAPTKVMAPQMFATTTRRLPSPFVPGAPLSLLAYPNCTRSESTLSFTYVALPAGRGRKRCKQHQCSGSCGGAFEGALRPGSAAAARGRGQSSTAGHTAKRRCGAAACSPGGELARTGDLLLNQVHALGLAVSNTL